MIIQKTSVWATLFVFSISLNTVVFGVDIMPAGVLTYPLASNKHYFADQINNFIENQTTYSGDFAPTGLKHQDYLKVIESLVRSMIKYQNRKGQIVDPVKRRELLQERNAMILIKKINISLDIKNHAGNNPITKIMVTRLLSLLATTCKYN